ncbi:MAG TPA: cobalt-precorrin-6A reductase [Polyangiaceae bacterium]|nr:cobalt-precorrin-6A reductase [Polyangiaceae bacterium]
MFKVLILGGTNEARRLANRLADDARFGVLLSFAGRTENLILPSTPYRVGGFGGSAGLAAFLQRERFGALIDATHPFAATMSRNAVEAARSRDVPLIRLERPRWTPEPADRWIPVADMPAAVHALGREPRRVFLTIGRQEVGAFKVAPQHDYLVRAIDAFDPELPRARVIAARGPFELAAELELMRTEKIDVLVSKNSGTDATYAKIVAARQLGLPVVLVEPPPLPEAPVARSLDEIVNWLERLHQAEVRRGV